MSTRARAVLFANGEARGTSSIKLLPDDFIVAVDGGLRHARALGLKVCLLVGDFDSIQEDELARCQSEGAEILRYPRQKDQTDLELALEAVLARGYTDIVITRALGGRMDHSLANLALLARPDLKDALLRFDEGDVEIFLTRKAFRAECQPGDIVSLLPWQGEARGVRTDGLAYPLERETMLPWQARGISNVCLGEEFSVSLEGGALLIIHQRPELPNQEAES